nr:3-dehydrosphinganine reductase [Sogatella furcifera]
MVLFAAYAHFLNNFKNQEELAATGAPLALVVALAMCVDGKRTLSRSDWPLTRACGGGMTGGTLYHLFFVLVTGGSRGIGRSVALEAVARGAHVTIIARNEVELKKTYQDLADSYNEENGKQTIQQIALDVTTNYEHVEQAIRCAEEYAGPVHMLVNCAGSSFCSKFEDTPMDEFEHMIKLNFLGSVSPTKAVIRGMKAKRSGHIVFAASQAALLGIFGYSAYSASKFALRGVAEALNMEAKPYGVCVTVALPPDTDTPGFAEEEKAKLEETRLISESAGLWSPDRVARAILDDAIDGKFFSTVGLEGNILTTACAGMSPVGSFFELMWQEECAIFLRMFPNTK